MMGDSSFSQPPLGGPLPHRRRERYPGRHPRRFEHKYKEHNPEHYSDTIAKVIASGKTPAGTHRPIMVEEILSALAPRPGELAVDCTIGYGGHARELLARLLPGGRLLGLDIDPVELPKTEVRLRGLGFGPETFTVHRSNFAGLPQILAAAEIPGADLILADLGVSSMQLDDPSRGFSMKQEGPLDMRMNPHRGQAASSLLKRIRADMLANIFAENADEPYARRLADSLAGRHFPTTTALTAAVHAALPRVSASSREDSVRRVFQALRIVVNDEFSALETFLRHLPACLNPAGRVAILTFHSGEDRRVKRAFEAGVTGGYYAEISPDVIRATAGERRSNPRSASGKLRWARASQERPVS